MADYEKIAVLTGGTGTGYAITRRLNGYLDRIIYTKTDFADTALIAVAVKGVETPCWLEFNVSSSKTVRPRNSTDTVAGVEALRAAGGENVNDRILIADQQCEIQVSSAGNYKTGTFEIVVGS